MTAVTPVPPELDERFSTRTHQPALDGIRGLAVAGVLLFHGGHLTGGYLGVDAFFVLSGFLITTLLVAEVHTTHTVKLGQFWLRRARRLLPALALVLVAVAIYAAFVADRGELAGIRGDALATIAYGANWHQVFTSGDYWALFRSPSPLQHTWSLAIEEQFYLVWPLIVLALTRKTDSVQGTRRVFVFSIIGAAVSFALMQVLFDPADTSRAYYGTDTRAASILVGAALATWIVLRGHASHARRAWLEVTAALALVALAIAWSHVDGNSTFLYRGGLLLSALATAAVIAAGVHPERGPIARGLSWKPLCALGIISYGVYLWHWPVFVYLNDERVHLSGWPLFFVRVAVTLVISYASYRFVEKPIRFGAHNARTVLRVVPVAAAILVAVILASTASAPWGSPASAGSTRGGVLLVGDSVAHSLFPGLLDEGLNAREVWSPGCRLLKGSIPVNKAFSNECEWEVPWRKAVIGQRPAVVVLMIGAWDLFDVTPPGTDAALVPGTTEWADYYQRRLEQAITLLSSRGAHVVIPTLPCFGRNERVGLEDRSAYNVERVRAANTALAEVAARHPQTVTTPDLFSYLCPHGTYQESLGSVKTMRSDGVHYGETGARMLTRWLEPHLAAAVPGADLRARNTGPRRAVLVYGDVFVFQARTQLDAEMAEHPEWKAVVRSSPLQAPCDMLASLKGDLAKVRPALLVLETRGSTGTACMQDSAGKALLPGTSAYTARVRSDVAAIFQAAHEANTRVIVVNTPPEPSAREAARQAELRSTLRELAEPYGSSITFDDDTAALLGGSTWKATMPCGAGERDKPECANGQIPVRGPDRVQLCSERVADLQAMALGCTTYSSGIFRYARALADVIADSPAATATANTLPG